MSNNYLATPDLKLAPRIAALPAVPTPAGPVDPAVVWACMNAMFTTVARKNLELFLPSEDSYRVADHKAPREGREVPVRVYLPAAEDDKRFPLILVIHGGGFMNGNLEMEDYFLLIICVDLHVVLVNVDDRLGPENPYPIGLNDTYDALKWTARNADLIHADLHKGFIVSGKSSGGNFAAIVAHRARDDPLFAETPLTGQILQMPAICHPDATCGVKNKMNLMEQCVEAPIYTRQQMYAEKLKENGVSTKLDIAVFGHTKVAQKWNNDFKEGVRWLLSFKLPGVSKA